MQIVIALFDRFTALDEDLRDRRLLFAFNLGIHVYKSPPEFLGESAAYGGFASSHEADQVEPWRALQLQCHDSVLPTCAIICRSLLSKANGISRLNHIGNQYIAGTTMVMLRPSIPRRIARAHSSDEIVNR